MYGIPRSTQDVDLVARLLPKHVEGLVSGLEALFHIDEEMVKRAVAERGPFNIIRRETLYGWLGVQMDQGATGEIRDCEFVGLERGPISITLQATVRLVGNHVGPGAD